MESANQFEKPDPALPPPPDPFEKTLGLLEFDRIRSMAAECARSAEAAELLLKEPPLRDPVQVEALKALTGELAARISSGGEPQGSFPDTAPILTKLAVEGTCLTLEEAYALGIFIELAEDLRRWILRISAGQTAGGRGDCAPSPLERAAAVLPDCSAASREIFRVMDKGGRLRDLPEFKEIQRRLRSLAGELEQAVSRYTSAEETRRMLQSSLPSQRDGRVVLALKANYRGRIKGIVHEVSATGQTLFVEPEEAVEKNNELLIEKRRLDAEILRVLREMTAALAGHREGLEELHRRVMALELLRAKARYSYETKGRFALSGGNAGPAHAGDGMILKGARHPLLGTRAVPIDLAMEARTVIITGPNTGGKTAALKTAGLFALMNQWGLALPAEEVILPVFDGIYADIGDEQSLSQSLSTFSAHMTNIAAIAKKAAARSLVLLDELGSGTDPEEGSAIAMAVLDHFIEKGVRLIATTHHGILKNYGYTRKGVENASVEFDGRTLSPTYRIVMGVPGESRAVDIAGRNGLAPSIVAAARSYLEKERTDVSALIRGLRQKRRELDAAAEERKSEETRLREERRRADLKELRLRQKELDLKSAGIGSLQRLLSESRKTLENLVREVKEGEMSREKTLKVKNFLRDLAGSAAAENEALEAESRALSAERRRLEAEYGEGSVDNNTGKDAAGMDAAAAQSGEGLAIEPGAEVLAGESRRRGRVIRADRKSRPSRNGSPPIRRWIVELGSLKISFPETELVPVRPLPGAKPFIAAADLAGTSQALFELSLRGMRLEEALETLERQIDAAALAGLRSFSVIHGKGDGILQRGVHEYLKTQPLVADYYFSRPELGGFGRTEVVLK
ncbi:MAG: Smr/MutS family protein [Treponema sp.]|jgi:DNA mismatch repair protein MutS2|nr:Smr/MutS family protein [Treponema sp.]